MDIFSHVLVMFSISISKRGIHLTTNSSEIRFACLISHCVESCSHVKKEEKKNPNTFPLVSALYDWKMSLVWSLVKTTVENIEDVL